MTAYPGVYRPPPPQTSPQLGPSYRQERQTKVSVAMTDTNSLGGSDLEFEGPKASSKVHAVAGDIHALEQRCSWLEERNIWLTKKLLQAQRRFIEKCMIGYGNRLAARVFEGWRNSLQSEHMEKQLEESTRSLDAVQQATRELGQALTQEQAAKAEAEAQHLETTHELQKAMEEEKLLQSQLQGSQRHLDFMQQRLHEAENSLVRSRAEAQSIVDLCVGYERTRREIESEGKVRRIAPENLLEQGLKTRQAAHGVLKQVTGLLRDQQQATPEGHQ